MEVLERFKRLTEGFLTGQQEVKEYYFEIERHLLQVEDHCKQIRVCINMLQKEMDHDDFNDYEEEPELPVEDYRIIRAKFGEEAANKMYYDVKFGKVPLRFVQRYLSQINTEEKQ